MNNFFNEYAMTLLELVSLRTEDKDKFYTKLYEAITVIFKERILKSKEEFDYTKSILLLISYFQEKEEFEKCTELQKLYNELIPYKQIL